jgi:UDPglucose 6-dehydrogenase
MRVAFWNELDSCALAGWLDTKNIIEGVSLDGCIGNGQNTPSLGYIGYCLLKDTMQSLADYGYATQTLTRTIVSSNTTRKDFVTEQILKRDPKDVSIYGLVMTVGSDNFR